MQLLHTRRRKVATALVTAALVAVPLVGAVAADAATATGVVNTTGNPGPALTVRSEPTAGSAAVGKRADGATVTIVCQTHGQQVTGTYGTTTIWDKVKSGKMSVTGAAVDVGGKAGEVGGLTFAGSAR